MRISDWSSDVCSSDLHLSPVDAVQDDPVAIAERLTGTPYLWGGRSSDGLDCSGMVQLCFSLCGIALPRDTDQQLTARGKDLPAGESLRRGYNIFFPGHVCLIPAHENILHDYAFCVHVINDPLADIISRLAADRAQPVLARKHISAGVMRGEKG